MKTVLRNVLALVLGMAIGGSINMGLILLGSSVIPAPAGVDVTDAKSIASSIHLFEVKHFVFPFLAHALGTLTGTLCAFLVAASYRVTICYVVGVLFLAGGIATTFMIPAPGWFIVFDIVVAYIPMAWIGKSMGMRISGSEAIVPADHGDA